MSPVSASPRRSLPFRALRAARRFVVTLAAGSALASASHVAAQNPGERDPNFLAAAIGFNVYSQFIEYYNGVPYIFVVGDRGAIFLLSAGDGSFNSATTPLVLPDFGNGARIIYTAVPEAVAPPEGTTPYILVGGQFGRSGTQIRDGLAPQNIKRLTPVGALDNTFNPNGRGANGFVTSIVPLADGGSVVGGSFDQYNGQDHLRLVRLDRNGVPVPSNVFVSNLNFDATVLSITAAPNLAAAGQAIALEQYVVAGQFSNVNGVSHPKLARVNYDGTLDNSFSPSFDARTTVVVAQPDGKVIVGGDFENVNGTPVKHIVRLNYDGSVDPTFVASVTGQPFGFINPPAVYVVRLLNDGRMYLGGNFTTVNGVTRNYLALVNADGTLDTSFDPGRTIVNAVQSVTVLADGKLLIGDNLSKANGQNIVPPVLFRLYGEAPTITLTATDPTAVSGDPGQLGEFTLTRSNTDPSGGPLTVYFTLGGNAKASKVKPNGTVKPKDYDLSQSGLTPTLAPDKSLIYTATLPVGADRLTLRVAPTNKTFKAASRNVVLTVISDPTGATTYEPGSTATVTIGH